MHLFNQKYCSLSSRRLCRLQRRGGRFFTHAEGQTSACSFPVSRRGYRVATTARTGTPSGTSVQPDAPISSIRPPTCLQRRDGSLAPHARSVTPPGCFLVGGWWVCSTRLADFVYSLPISPSQVRWQYFNLCLATPAYSLRGDRTRRFVSILAL